MLSHPIYARVSKVLSSTAVFLQHVLFPVSTMRATCSTDVRRDLITLTALIATNYPVIHYDAFFPPVCEIRSAGFLSYPILIVHPPSLHA
jgi:hypothetical protein